MKYPNSGLGAFVDISDSFHQKLNFKVMTTDICLFPLLTEGLGERH